MILFIPVHIAMSKFIIQQLGNAFQSTNIHFTFALNSNSTVQISEFPYCKRSTTLFQSDTISDRRRKGVNVIMLLAGSQVCQRLDATRQSLIYMCWVLKQDAAKPSIYPRNRAHNPIRDCYISYLVQHRKSPLWTIYGFHMW